MTGNWINQLEYDPIPPLLSTESKALETFIKQDLLDLDVGSIEF